MEKSMLEFAMRISYVLRYMCITNVCSAIYTGDLCVTKDTEMYFNW